MVMTFTISWFGLGHQNPGIADPAELGLRIYAATEPAKPESYGFPVHFVIHLRSLSYGGQSLLAMETGMRSPTNGRHTPRKWVSSKPRSFDSIADVSEYWIACLRGRP
jgi:hypothetical protein